ncbi:MAG: BREX system P-loop protein BrxC, partial [Thermoguttaceae bacterium]|nr:BREX system P-loop protein BrxC [Thermoguttaceae bacterium]
MLIKEMFVKPIDRELRGVIKVGQNDAVGQELEEYVVTKELKGHFSTFFEAYAEGLTRRTDEMAVWISGFFGSGKSHFLKILAYLLENREVNGKRAVDYFIDDKKIVDQTILGNMELAARPSTDVILFNIDSLSNASGKEKEPILPIFRRAFDEHLGYCGRNPYVADLERELTARGKYEEFKRRFEEKQGERWEESRDELFFISESLVSSLVETGVMAEKPARDWYEKAQNEYSNSPRDFAKLLKDYLSDQGEDHQIVFLVDEIGQYIGDNSGLMLNLQTLVEDIGVMCGSRVWVIVTSQQNIDDITKVRGNDFSKIQGRFKTRLSLSSSNVREVIQKRILRKNKTAEKVLTALYENKQTILKNLVNFKNDAELKVYDGAENFSALYPFIPYQVNLTQKVLTTIRQYSSSGKHLSDGERSMLSLFQLSAMAVMDQPEGRLVPLHFFYDALENFLDHNHRMVIDHALDNSHLNPNGEPVCFEVNLLKTLFLIKYLPDFDPTLENIVTLMVSGIDDDRGRLTARVQEALEKLVKETLVLKHNGKYVFQTDQEQETTRRIWNMEVNLKEITNELYGVIFSEDELYPVRRFHYSNQNLFNYQQSIDGDLLGKTGDIGIKIFTPNSPNKFEPLRTSGDNSLYVVLPDDRRFLEELEYALKIEKFLLQTANDPKIDQKIRDAKAREKQERRDNALSLLKTALMEAKIYSNGEEIAAAGSTVKARLNQAMNVLVERVFFNLSYITEAKSENDVKTILRSNDHPKLFDGGTDLPNGAALDAMLRHIDENTSGRGKLALKDLLSTFAAPPYGYAESDIEWLLAQLFVGGEVEISLNAEVLTPDPEDAENNYLYFTKQLYREKVLVRSLEKSSTGQRRAAQNIAKDLFGEMIADSDDYTMKRVFQEKLSALKDALSTNLKRIEGHPRYPGRETMEAGLKAASEILDCKSPGEFFSKIVEWEKTLLDFAEDYEEVKHFYDEGSKQPGLIDEAEAALSRYEQCRSVIQDSTLGDAAARIEGILGRKPITSHIQELPQVTDLFNEHYRELLRRTKEPILTKTGEVMEEINRRLEAAAGAKKGEIDSDVRQKMEQFQA